MSVYVDDMRAPFGRMFMCHMIADDDAELLAMARRIGVQTKWHQYPGTARSHFDVCLAKRALAVRHGAIEITVRELALKVRARREAAVENQLYEAERQRILAARKR